MMACGRSGAAVPKVLGLACLLVATLALPGGALARRGPMRVPAAGGPVWSIATTLPAQREYPAVAAGHDGNIYVFGGEDGPYVDFNTTFIYHQARNTWTQGPNMPTTREGAQAVTLADGRIAVLGGGTGGACGPTLCTIDSTVEIYTPWTHRWATAAPMQQSRYRFAAVLGKDGRIYAIGGYGSGAQLLSSVEAYNSKRNRWTYVFSLPQAEVGLAAAVSPSGTIVVVGGTSGSGDSPYDNVWLYSARTGWSSGAAMPTAREDLAAATGPDGQIYAIGGYNSGFLSTVEAYNPLTNSWSSGPPTPSAVCCMGAVRMPTRQIYAVGGSAGPPVPVLTFPTPAHPIVAEALRVPGRRAPSSQ